MRRRSQILPFAFAATLIGGCLGSFGTPGGAPDPTPQPTPAGGNPSTGGGDPAAPTGGGGSAGSGGGGSAGSGGGGSGGGGGGGTVMPPAQTGSLTLALDKSTDAIRLNETKTYTVTMTPAGGFTGGVTLSLSGAPTGVTAKFNPATVNITGTAPATATVDVTVASDGTASPATPVALAVKAVSGSISSSANLAVTIPAELLITVAKGVAIGSSASPNTAAFGGTNAISVHFVQGLKITWLNNDTINHEIHAQASANPLGIAHEGGPLMANAANAYSQTITGPGTIKANDTHCHIHTNMIGPTITVLP